MPLDVSRAPGSASPLWVIALFIALSEATAGVAAVTTDGAARILFACFAVAFPSVVFGVFVWLLVKHAPNLYPPGQYSREITPEIYRIGIGSSDPLVLGHAVAESILPILESKVVEKDHMAVVEQVAKRFDTEIRKYQVDVSIDQDLTTLVQQVRVHVLASTTVSDFLNSLYLSLMEILKPSTYNRTWVLVDKDGVQFNNIGRTWAGRRGRESDNRLLSEIGITPGTPITAMRKSRGLSPKQGRGPTGDE